MSKVSVNSGGDLVSWDFNNVDKFLKEGFDDLTIEALCDHDYVQKDLFFGGKKRPQLFWPVELYSYGKCYRQIYNWPDWLPLPVYGDHGVDQGGALRDHELRSLSKYHLYFHCDKFTSIKDNEAGKIPLHVPHPWVVYRRERKFVLRQNQRAVLLFVPHTVESVRHEDFERKFSLFIEEARLAYSDFNTIALCIQMHDVRKGLHRELRKYNLPIFTLGNSLSEFFVDRFYGLVGNFSHAASPSSGSQLYYCVEFGLRYHLLGERIQFALDDPGNEKDGEVINFRDHLRLAMTEAEDRLFRGVGASIEDQLAYVNDVLGLSAMLDDRSFVRRIFILESVRLWPHVFLSVLRHSIVSVSFKLNRVINGIKRN